VRPDPDQLYALPREEFTAARREMVRQAKADGDKDTAAAIGKLAKPTKAAWLANRLARDHRKTVVELLGVGDDLRAAHGRGAGPRLRELTQRRTELINALLRLADESLSEPVTRELEEMFTAAVADETAADILRAGRVASVRDLAIAPAWPGLAITPRTVGEQKPRVKPKADDSRARKAAFRKALADAKSAVKAAEADRAGADRAQREAEAAVTAAEKRVRDLNAELDAAEAAELEARQALHATRRTAKDAERAAGQAWRTLQRVEETSTEDA